MATIKAYTDISQSKKLTEILPIESADMFWKYNPNIHTYDDIPKILVVNNWDDDYNKNIPCWSLSALLCVFPYYEINNNGVNIQLSVKGEALITEEGECLLDLIVNMIIHLHELKML